MFAYSSVGQIGYITLGLSLDSAVGLTAAIVHLFNHAVTKGALFLLLGGIAFACGTTRLRAMAGVGRTMPVAAFGIVIGGLSLIGVPGTAGFVSKWYLILAALEAGRWWLAAAIVASSLLAIAYVWRFVEVAYLREPAPGPAMPGEAPWSMRIPAYALVAATIWFGLDTSLTVGSASAAAAALLGVSP
jgi:multicomponent Na+:H+ antiporter subunit D